MKRAQPLLVIALMVIACVGAKPKPEPQVLPSEQPATAKEEAKVEHAEPATTERSERARAWLKRLTTPSARFSAERLTFKLYPTVRRGAFPNLPGTGPGAQLELVTAFCTVDHGIVPPKITCSGALPRRTNAEIDARETFDSFMKEARKCGLKLQLRSAEPLQLASIGEQLPWGRSGTFTPEAGSAVFVGVTHVMRRRVYENDCTHVEHRPCDPVGNWATDRFETSTYPTFELKTASGSAPLHFPFEQHDIYLQVPMFGVRESGWFVPDPVFDPVFTGASSKTALDALIAKQGADADEELTLALTRSYVALQTNDGRTPELAAAFVKLAAARPITAVHFELRPIVVEALPLMRQLAAGQFSSADPCKR